MQEIQRFSDDNGNVHRLIASTDGGKEGVSLETAHMLTPDHWIPRQHWYFVNGNIQTIAGGHVIVHCNSAEYIYRPMTTEVEVKDCIDDDSRLTPTGRLRASHSVSGDDNDASKD